MDFKELLPEGVEKEILDNEIEVIEEKVSEKIGEEQFFDVITSRKPDWQQIIYDLINSEQLDPWDIDLVILTKKYFEKIFVLEEQDYYVSSKVLLAASLLLRIKSELLLNKHIKSIDDILFGKKEENKQIFERIIIDESELPVLIPKTPMPRLKKVTLDELMSALNKAINTESRRIKKEVQVHRAKKLSEIDFPEFRRIDLKDRIRGIYAKIMTSVKKISNNKRDKNKELNKVCYSNLAGNDRMERLSCFLPILHLSNNKKLWLEQENHLDEIWIYLYEYFSKNKDNFIEELEEDIEAMKKELEENEIISDDTEMIEGELGKAINDIDKEIDEEIENKIEEIEKDEKIDDVTGFSVENV
ncbi:segregation/condensation protein A [Candidatus Pacearchaeota archaeon]|nr:segregation/condensation protein A [Candidatus Pacearchaeota archaeon]